MKKKISMLLACAMTVNFMSVGMTALAASATDDPSASVLRDWDDWGDDDWDDDGDYEDNDYDFGDPEEDDDDYLEANDYDFGDPEEDDDDYLEANDFDFGDPEEDEDDYLEFNDFDFGDPEEDIDDYLEANIWGFGDPEEDIDYYLEPQMTAAPTATPSSGTASDEEETEDLEEFIDYGALYSGTWVDDKGFVCIIDTMGGTFTDSYGCTYSLVGIAGNGIVISETSDQSAFNDSMIPVHGTIYMGCELSEDGSTLSIGDREAVRLESEEGQEISGYIAGLLAGNEFSLGQDHAVISFNDDMTEMENELILEGVQDISFDGIGIHFLDVPGYTAYIRLQDDVPMMAYEGSLTPMADGEVLLPGMWVVYDGSTDQSFILDYTDADNPIIIEPSTGESGALSTLAPAISAEGQIPVIAYDGLQFYGGYAASGVFFTINPDSSSGESDEISAENCYLLMQADSPYAGEMVRRYTTSAGSSGTSSETSDYFQSGFLTYDRYDNEWSSDIVYARELTKYFINYSGDLALVPLTCAVYVVRNDDRDITLSFDYDGDISDTASIYYIESYINGVAEPVETSFASGYAECELGETGIYVLADQLPAVELNLDNYFNTDPMESAWGMSELSGDIPQLVDLDYIEENMGDVFVVTNAVELASVTYFVNTYPYPNGIIVDLQDDIDLSGYDWAPIGVPSEFFGDYNAFRGYFFGNGHNIIGLSIDNDYAYNAFFGHIVNSTVVGLGIEGAEISGSGSCILAISPDNCDFADCHVIGELPDAWDNLVNRFGISYPAGGNTYRDCYCSINTMVGNYEADIDLVYEYAPENIFISAIDPEGDGTYDYSADYLSLFDA